MLRYTLRPSRLLALEQRLIGQGRAGSALSVSKHPTAVSPSTPDGSTRIPRCQPSVAPLRALSLSDT